jgi:hypothetical protein
MRAALHWWRLTVLDIVFLALGLGTFALMIFYARWAAST